MLEGGHGPRSSSLDPCTQSLAGHLKELVCELLSGHLPNPDHPPGL